jgi:hypothetical protein
MQTVQGKVRERDPQQPLFNVVAFDVAPSVEGARIEMSLGKGATRSGLEVALESEGGQLIAELDRDEELPRAIPARLPASGPEVVPLEAIGHVCRRADVVTRRIRLAAENVDKALADAGHGAGHSRNRSKRC